MSTIIVSGASGLVGRELAALLERRGDRVKRLVRRTVQSPDTEVFWDPDAGRIDAAGLAGADAVVHLAGENIASRRWTEAFKQRVVQSRVRGTTLLAETLAAMPEKPRVLVSASATGFYGDRPGETVDEESPAGGGFLAETTRQWEAATRPAWEAGVRVVQTRIGVVLSGRGGALAKLLPLFRWGLGGRLGDGQQVMSWIALPDLARALAFAIDTETLHGAVNATAPGAVSNAEFTRTLAGVLGRCACVPAPAFGLRLMVGEMADEVLLAGARVAPTRLVEAGFTFQTPELEPALRAVLGR